jgi:hypothetical protein
LFQTEQQTVPVRFPLRTIALKGTAQVLSLPYATRYRAMLAPLERAGDRLRAGYGKRDPRVLSSATLLGVILCAALSFALAPAAGSARMALTPEADPIRSIEAIRAGEVKMLDGKPRSEVCEEQTWPYIDRRCIRSVAGMRPSAAADSRAASPEPAGPAVTPAAAANETAAAPASSVHEVPLPPSRPIMQAEAYQQSVGSEPFYAGPREAVPSNAGMPPYWMAGQPYEMQRWRYEERRVRSQRRVRRGGLHIGGFYFRF